MDVTAFQAKICIFWGTLACQIKSQIFLLAFDAELLWPRLNASSVG
jgi:hypothetical protein